MGPRARGRGRALLMNPRPPAAWRGVSGDAKAHGGASNWWGGGTGTEASLRLGIPVRPCNGLGARQGLEIGDAGVRLIRAQRASRGLGRIGLTAQAEHQRMARAVIPGAFPVMPQGRACRARHTVLTSGMPGPLGAALQGVCIFQRDFHQPLGLEGLLRQGHAAVKTSE